MFHVKHFIENEKIRYFLFYQKEHVKSELTSFEEQLIKNTNSLKKAIKEALSAVLPLPF